jgi:hypothetical protein
MGLLRSASRAYLALKIAKQVAHDVWRADVLPGDCFSFPGHPVRPAYLINRLAAYIVVERVSPDRSDPGFLFGHLSLRDLLSRGRRERDLRPAIVYDQHIGELRNRRKS